MEHKHIILKLIKMIVTRTGHLKDKFFCKFHEIKDT